RLNDLVQATLADVDVVCLCVPANEPIGPGDRFINEQLDDYPRAVKVAIVTKVDTVGPAKIAAQLLAVSGLREWADIGPVSAVGGDQLDVLIDVLIGHLPESPPLYPADSNTEETLEERIAEQIREAALADVRDELPHSIAVTV